MKAQLLIASIIITSCGPDQSKGGKDDLYSGQPQNSIEYAEPSPKEVVTEYRKEGSEMALVIGSSADLPECDNANDRQLVYLKDQKIFMTCDDGRWLEVDIKGEKGEAGAQGPEGKEGPKGDDGATGATGPQGPKGDDGKPLASNEWLDPITGKRWLIGGTANWAYVAGAYVAPACSGDYRSPTIEEARAVILHGIGPKLTPFGFVWTTHESTEFPTTMATAIAIGGANESDKAKSTVLDIICLYSPVP